jgi:nitroreductase
MENVADTNHAIHELLKTRWSPRAFANRPVEKEKLLSLFEAARWSPSGGNRQPWAFIVVTKDDAEIHQKLVEIMTGRNPLWAGNVPVLVLTAAKVQPDAGTRNRFSYYDVGQAVAHLSVQATALGLHVHQMAGFDVEKAHQLFNLPDDYEPMTLIAIGYMGQLTDLAEELQERETAARVRKPLNEFVFEGGWEQPLKLAPALEPEATHAK